MSKLTKIQESARGEDCTFNLARCNHDPATTVLCHDTRHVPNSPRRCDARAAYGCSYCHDVVDYRYIIPLSKTEFGDIWGRAIARTHVKLMEKGLLKFEGIEPVQKMLPRR